MMLDEQTDPGVVAPAYVFQYQGAISAGTVVDTVGAWPLTITGDVTSVSDGGSGSCIQLGNSDGVASTVSNFTPLVSTSYFELEFDIRSAIATPAAGSDYWMSKYTANQSCMFITGDPTSSISVYVDTSKTVALSDRNAFSLGGPLSNVTWKHIKIVYDGSQSVNINRVKLWRDGVLITPSSQSGTFPATTTNSTAPFQIGYAGTNTKNIQFDNVTFRLTPS